MEHATCLGSRIKRLRKAKGLTAARLAERVGITENALRKLESGDSKEPRFSTGVRLARALNVDAVALAAHTGTPTEGPALSTVIGRIRTAREELGYAGVEHVDVFGSVARGEADIDSDVDVLVSAAPETSLSLFDLASVGGVLERILNRNVDVVTRGSLKSSSFAETIEKEAVRAF